MLVPYSFTQKPPHSTQAALRSYTVSVNKMCMHFYVFLPRQNSIKEL